MVIDKTGIQEKSPPHPGLTVSAPQLPLAISQDSPLACSPLYTLAVPGQKMEQGRRVRLTRSLNLTALITVLLTALPLSANARTIRVSIDTTTAREPISHYIYGQFIEHLGRSIYGGIWSGMLEDRKFFYPVTGEAPAWIMFKPGLDNSEGEGHPYELLARSPWMIIGEKGAVTMMAGNSTRAWPEESRSPAMSSYVGVHTPSIQPPRRRESGWDTPGASRSCRWQEVRWADCAGGRPGRGAHRSEPGLGQRHKRSRHGDSRQTLSELRKSTASVQRGRRNR